MVGCKKILKHGMWKINIPSKISKTKNRIEMGQNVYCITLGGSRLAGRAHQMLVVRFGQR